MSCNKRYLFTIDLCKSIRIWCLLQVTFQYVNMKRQSKCACAITYTKRINTGNKQTLSLWCQRTVFYQLSHLNIRDISQYGDAGEMKSNRSLLKSNTSFEATVSFYPNNQSIILSIIAKWFSWKIKYIIIDGACFMANMLPQQTIQ